MDFKSGLEKTSTNAKQILNQPCIDPAPTLEIDPKLSLRKPKRTLT